MELKINKNDSKPIYQQIVSYFESLIMKGELQPGSLLPPERELALQVDVNRSTVANAYNILRSTGLIVSKQGRGTIVSDTLQKNSKNSLVNWLSYINNSYTPIYPMAKRILNICVQKKVINLALSNLSSDILINYLNCSLSEIPLRMGSLYSEEIENITKQYISQALLDFNIEANPKDILLTGGIKQALLLIIKCLLNPGESVAVESPSFLYTSQLFLTGNIKMVPIPRDEDGIDPKSISQLYKKNRVKMVFISSTFQSPTGTTLSTDRRNELVKICSKLRIPIIEISSPSALNHNNNKKLPPSLYSISTEKSLIINIGCFSDVIGVDTDFGWVIAPKVVLDLLTDAKVEMGLGVSTFNQQILIEIIKQGIWKRFVKNKNKLLLNRKNYLMKSIYENMGDSIEFKVPDGGLYLWCKSNKITNDKIFLEKCIQNGVLIVPGYVFGSEAGYFRLSFGQISNFEIEEGIKRVSRAFYSSF